MGDLAIATLVNVTLYERDNTTLIFETQCKTIEVHTTHSPYTQNAGYTFDNCSIYNQVGKSFKKSKEMEAYRLLKSVRQDKADANLPVLNRHRLHFDKEGQASRFYPCMYAAGAISYWLYSSTASSWTLLRRHSIWLLSLFAEDTPQPYQKMFVMVKQYRHKNWVYSYIPNRIRAG
jgi:hypothetical protein